VDQGRRLTASRAGHNLDAVFPTTRWTLIFAARDEPEARRAALETLLSTYWKPVYFYARKKGLSVEAAEDATQGLFLQILERDILARVDPAKGRFRSYLLTSFDHYLVNEYERGAAVKRGGRVRMVPLDTAVAERELPAAPEDPARAFDREWAAGVMDRALVRLRREYDEGRRKGPADVFLSFFRLDAAPSYADAAAACGLTTVQFKAALHRARERFREILREEVAPTVGDDGAADDEMRALVEALSA
jgi:RNA polymerase sigma factor (sigma-70 family)